MSAPAVIVSAGAASHAGRRRRANEDAYLAESPIFLVADGMGGYEAGDLASRAVAESFRARVTGAATTTVEAVRDALADADEAVAAIAAGTSRGAGSTVTGVALVDDDGVPSWLVFNIGDSRVYRHLGTELQQLTVDHSLAQELVDDGSLAAEDVATFAQRNVITRAIGAPDSTADSWLLPVTNGERLLLCSDGLTGEVSDEAIRATLTMTGRPESAAAALVERANDAGGRDNITVVVVDVVTGGRAVDADGTVDDDQTGDRIESTLDATTIPVRGTDA